MNLLSLKFWFMTRPNSLVPAAQKSFIIFVIILLVLTFIFSLLKKKNKRGLYNRLWGKFYSFCLANFFIGLFLLFFTYELIPFLSSRFWFPVWAAGMITWLVFIIKYMVKIPKIKEEIAKEKEYKKYIP